MGSITKQQISQLFNIIKTANSCGIEELVIEKNTIRGITNKSIILFDYDTPNNIDWSFLKFATNRLSLLVNRFNLFNMDDNISATTILKNEQFVMSIQLKTDKMKIDFRCTDPSIVEGSNKDRLPKKVGELSNLCYIANLNDDFLNIYAKGMSAMKSDHVRFISDIDGKLNLEFEDINGDKFTCYVGGTFVTNDEIVISHEFNFKYDAKILLPLLKQSIDNQIFLTKRGLLKCVINNLTFLIPPEVK